MQTDDSIVVVAFQSEEFHNGVHICIIADEAWQNIVSSYTEDLYYVWEMPSGTEVSLNLFEIVEDAKIVVENPFGTTLRLVRELENYSLFNVICNEPNDTWKYFNKLENEIRPLVAEFVDDPISVRALNIDLNCLITTLGKYTLYITYAPTGKSGGASSTSSTATCDGDVCVIPSEDDVDKKKRNEMHVRWAYKGKFQNHNGVMDTFFYEKFPAQLRELMPILVAEAKVEEERSDASNDGELSTESDDQGQQHSSVATALNTVDDDADAILGGLGNGV